MRFAAFLREELRSPLSTTAVDDCAGLVPHLPEDEGLLVSKILTSLTSFAVGVGLAHAIDAESCDLVGCFWLLPSRSFVRASRVACDALLQKAASGGVVCASFWQFMGDEKFVKKG